MQTGTAMKPTNSKTEGSSKESSTPKQNSLDLTPEYAEQDGVKFEFSGTLLIPAPGEAERLAREKLPEMNPVCLATPQIMSPQSHYHGYRNTTERKSVKMSALQMFKLRRRGA